jgi:TRAP-type C4-dicarboxylate transport system permease small subunit
MPPRVQKRIRIILSAMALLMLAPLTFAFAWAGLRAVPRERCQWLEDQFCSDYGRFYLAFGLICAFMLVVALRLINRRPKSRDLDVSQPTEN